MSTTQNKEALYHEIHAVITSSMPVYREIKDTGSVTSSTLIDLERDAENLAALCKIIREQRSEVVEGLE